MFYLLLQKILLSGILLDILYDIAILIHYDSYGYTHSYLFYTKAAAELRGIIPIEIKFAIIQFIITMTGVCINNTNRFNFISYSGHYYRFLNVLNNNNLHFTKTLEHAKYKYFSSYTATSFRIADSAKASFGIFNITLEYFICFYS